MPSFLAGIGSIQTRPDIAPANKISTEIQAVKDYRHKEILAELEGGGETTVEQLALILRQHESTVRSDVAELMLAGKIREVWKHKIRTLRRSTL